MTDLALVAVLVFMAVLLGASLLAIFLLYRGWKSNRKLITDLRAQIAAQQIAALTGATVPQPAAETDAEPVRRKRHLALYLGGPVIAVFTTCRESLRSLFRARKGLTVTAAVATVATVGTAAALVLTSSGSGDNDGPAPSTASTDQPAPGATPSSPGPHTSSADHTASHDEEAWALERPHLTVVEGDHGAVDGETPAPSRSARTSPAGEATRAAGHGAAPSTAPPANTPGLPDSGRPPTEEPANTTPPPGSGNQEPPSGTPPKHDHGLCVELPPLVDLCLLSSS